MIGDRSAAVKRGTTSGINDFFYLEKIEPIPKNKTLLCKNKRGWDGEIETKYLKNLIKDPSRYESIAITKNDVKEQNLFVFYCDKSKAELKKAGDLGSSKYIEWGEKQVTENNIKFPDVSSVKHRKNWHTLSNLIDYPIAYLAASNNRFIAFSNQSKYALDKRLYGISPKNQNVIKLLNSFFNILHLEAYGKEINNGNAKEFTVEEVEHMLVPDIDIDYDISGLSQRKIKTIFEEIKEQDRITLDSEILEKLGLDPKVYLPRIYDGITQMVRERLELPKMRKKQQKQKIKISYEQVKESVIKECIGTTLKKFPEAFYTIGKAGKDYDDLEFEIFNTSGKSLTIHSFMNQHEVSDELGEIIFATDSLIKAEFATLLAKPNIFGLKIPKEEKIAEGIISKYKAYVKQLKEQIELNANQKLHSWSEAEKMTKEILEEYGLKVEGIILGG